MTVQTIEHLITPATLVQLSTAFAVDLLVGDPRWLPHPVRLIGRLITGLERVMRRGGGKPKRDLAMGALLAVLVIGIVFFAAYAFTVLLLPLKGLHVAGVITAYDLSIGVAGAFALATRSLAGAVEEVRRFIEAGNIIEARSALSMIVGRDTGKLDKEDICRALVETASENTSDGIVAPMLYFMIGGLPLAFAYKAINTIDSMIGYKNERYLYFGRAGARMDDLANFLPSRLTGVLIAFSTFAINCFLMLQSKNLDSVMKWLKDRFRPANTADGSSRNDATEGKLRNSLSRLRGGVCEGRLDWVSSVRVAVSDGKKHSSPNAGIPEAAMAGALGVRLGGPSFYGGVVVEKPYIGYGTADMSTGKVRDSVLILVVSSLLAFVLFSLLSLYI
ncbi:MAG: cobalamin biosynthesis protein CobD [Nitrospirae bacterium]|nr:cobalamin biosynthesis protein CobD [Nitrospirota bacterium]